MGILIHRQHRYPMRRTGVEFEVTVGIPDGIRERAPARDNEDSLRRCGVCNGLQRGFEVDGMRHQSPADLDKNVHDPVSHLCSLSAYST
jgi:hypothetical protein